MWANEIDPYCAAWLRNLYPGITVDERSIADLSPADIRDPRSHFFAGIGGWEYALDLAGWPASRPVWTGSCPCQPLSGAGLQKGHTDERHLWPAFFALIAECRPATVFGEQVSGKLGREWISGVRADLESIGYAVGIADLAAAGVGAPHIRQRLFWVAHTQIIGRGRRMAGRDQAGDSRRRTAEARGSGGAGGVADSGCLGDERRGGPGEATGSSPPPAREAPERERRRDDAWVRGGASGLALAQVERLEGWRDGSEGLEASSDRLLPPRSGQSTDPWGDARWIACLDGKARRIESGTLPLAHGIPARASKLRAYGNAIVPQVAATFVRSFLEAEQMTT